MGELYELPDGWEYVKLTDVVTKERTSIKRGPFGSALKKAFFVKSGYKVYEQKNAIRDDFSLGEYYITEEKFNELKGFEVKGGDIIISCSGTIGKISVAPINIEKGIINQALLKLTLNNQVIDRTYFVNFWIDYVNKGMSEESTKGAAIKNIASVKVLKNLDIPLPPLQEQKRIVAKLDSLFEKIDRAIALHQQNINEVEKFMGSVLNEVFGELEEKYEKKTLVSFDKKMSAGGTPLRKEKKYWNGSVEWFSSGELNQLYTLPANEKITQIGLENSSAKLFPKGTLLIGMYDTAAMKMSILSNDGSCNQAIVGFKPKENELNIFFVKYQLEYLKEKILEQRQGVRQQNLNLSKLKNIEIEYPPLQIQQKTVTYLDQISQKTEQLKKVQQEKLESLKALKASILDRAFRGEL